MDYAAHFTLVASVALLAAISPGPNFVTITSAALASRRSGLWAACGVAAASLTWATLGAVGLAVLIARVAWLYEMLRIVGAAYLVYLGLHMLWGLRRRPNTKAVEQRGDGAWAILRRGYLANMANPKSAAFVGSFFASVLPTDAPSWLFASTALTVASVSAAWSVCLALLFSTDAIRGGYARARGVITALLGVALVGLGARLAVTR